MIAEYADRIRATRLSASEGLGRDPGDRLLLSLHAEGVWRLRIRARGFLPHRAPDFRGLRLDRLGRDLPRRTQLGCRALSRSRRRTSFSPRAAISWRPRSRRHRTGDPGAGRLPRQRALEVGQRRHALRLEHRHGDRPARRRCAAERGAGWRTPLADATVLDTWRGQVAGLAATGSNDIVVKDLFIPDHMAVTAADLTMGTTPGSKLHANPMYRMPIDGVSLAGDIGAHHRRGARRGRAVPRALKIAQGHRHADRSLGEKAELPGRCWPRPTSWCARPRCCTRP